MIHIKNISKTVQLVLLVIISLLISILVFFFEIFLKKNSFGIEKENPITFLSNYPILLIWIFMGIIQIVFCVILAPVVWNEIKDLNQKFVFRRKDIYIMLLLLILFILTTLLFTLLPGTKDVSSLMKDLINHAAFKLAFIISISYLITSGCIYILLLINTVINNLKIPTYFEYIFLKKKLELVLNIIGFIITASTVATALLQTQFEKAGHFPKQIVYAYGLFNTLYIALIFVPVSFNLTSLGKEIIELKLKDSKLENNDPETFLKKKKMYEELYELKEDYLSILKTAVPILAPLLASLFNYAGLK